MRKWLEAMRTTAKLSQGEMSKLLLISQPHL